MRVKRRKRKTDVKIIKSERKIQPLKTESERLNGILNQKEINYKQNEKYAELLIELYEKSRIDMDGKFVISDTQR